MARSTFCLCDLTVALECPSTEHAAGLIAQWRRMFSLQPASETARPDVTFQLDFEREASEPPPDARPICLGRDLDVHRTDTGFRLSCGTSVLDVHPSAGRVEGTINGDLSDRPRAIQRELFLLTFLMMFRPRGRFGVHGNGLIGDGRGVLVVGASGQGKTTTTLTLVRQGWSYVADDALALMRGTAGIEALALRRGFSCTPATAAMFPELRRFLDAEPESDDGKALADGDDLYPGQHRPKCVPRMLLFPGVTADASQTRLLPLDPTTTMTGLIEQSPGLMADRRGAAGHMGVLRDLVEQAPAYRILLGRDVIESPKSVKQIVTSVLMGEPCRASLSN